MKHLSRKQIVRIVTKFEQYGTIGDRRKDTRIRQRTGRSHKHIEEVKKIIQETPTKSVRNVFRELDSNISSSSVIRILKNDSKFTKMDNIILLACDKRRTSQWKDMSIKIMESIDNNPKN